MSNKTCGECRKFKNIRCGNVEPNYPACIAFESKLTNGDVIRQGNNRKLAEIFDDLYSGNKCKYCVHHAGSSVCKLTDQHAEYDEGEFDEDEVCVDGIESWLNAPAGQHQEVGK